MYEVVKYFTDLQDGNYAYHAGDTFPREGVTVSDERIAELSGSNNRRGIPLIKSVSSSEAAKEDAAKEEEAPKPKRATRKKKEG